MEGHDETIISQFLGIEYKQDLSSYLGVTMIYSRMSRNSYSFILDKIWKKLSTWKVNDLF